MGSYLGLSVERFFRLLPSMKQFYIEKHLKLHSLALAGQSCK